MSELEPGVRAVLLKVRDEILTDESKWAKGEGIRLDTTPTCLGMAIIQATPDAVSRITLSARAALGFEAFDSIPDWNDAPERTFADVRARLDRALGQDAA